MASLGKKEAEDQYKAIWCPQPGPQANAICADWCPCIFYGGGKYSGKSDFLLGDYLQDLETYREHWQGIIFRRSLTEFTELKLRASELFPKAGGIWREQKSQWEFPKYGRKEGETTLQPILRFKYLENLKDVRLYEGHSYPWIGVDELGDWEDPDAFFRLFTFNRYGRAHIPTKRIRATGNPGGRGHQWIKEYFVDPAPFGSKLLYDEVLKSSYMFILGTYRDNTIGMMNDPQYADRMNRAGSPALVRALKEGDFSVVAGAFFPEWSDKNIVYPFKIPNHWMKYQSMDWGGCGEGDPFSIGWWAVSDGDTQNDTIPYLPRGTKVRYREWYGKGLPRVTVSEVAAGIFQREQGEKIQYRLAGGDIKKKGDKSGPSIFEMFSDHGLHFVRADMNRAPGWLKMREEIRGPENIPEEFRMPTTRVFSTCLDSIKLIPSAQHGLHDANDIEEFNDDLLDEWRYGLMGRAQVLDKPKKERTLEEKFKPPTINEIWTIRDMQQRRR